MQCLLLGKIRFFAHSGSCARSSLTNKLLAGWRQIADSVLCAFQIGSHCFCKPCCAVWCVTDEWWVICQLAEDSLCSSGIVIALHWSKFGRLNFRCDKDNLILPRVLSLVDFLMAIDTENLSTVTCTWAFCHLFVCPCVLARCFAISHLPTAH